MVAAVAAGGKAKAGRKWQKGAGARTKRGEERLEKKRRVEVRRQEAGSTQRLL